MSDDEEALRAAIEVRVPGTSPLAEMRREKLLEVCADFVASELADPTFLGKLGLSESSFWSCLSEALVWRLLVGKTFGARERIGKGPDFLVMDGDRRVWVEVICPEGIVDADNARLAVSGLSLAILVFPPTQESLRLNVYRRRPTQQHLLVRKGHSALAAGQPSLSVNACQLRSRAFSYPYGTSQHSFALEAVLPIGDLQIKLDKATARIIGHEHQFRPRVQRPKGEPGTCAG